MKILPISLLKNLFIVSTISCTTAVSTIVVKDRLFNSGESHIGCNAYEKNEKVPKRYSSTNYSFNFALPTVDTELDVAAVTAAPSKSASQSGAGFTTTFGLPTTQQSSYLASVNGYNVSHSVHSSLSGTSTINIVTPFTDVRPSTSVQQRSTGLPDDAGEPVPDPVDEPLSDELVALLALILLYTFYKYTKAKKNDVIA